MVKPSVDWPPSTKPFRSNPPDGAVGIVLPIRDNLKFFKLAFHSILDFTDHRYMLTVVDNMSGFSTRQYLDSIRRNHPINVLQYQSPHSLSAEWNLGLRFMFAFASVSYGLCLTPSVVVEPNWLSRLVRILRDRDDAGAVEPYSNLCGSYGPPHEATLGEQEITLLKPSCLAFKRPVYERLGGFDERLSEGVYVARDFGDRARKAGLRLLCASEVSIHAFARHGWVSDPAALSSDLDVMKAEVPA